MSKYYLNEKANKAFQMSIAYQLKSVQKQIPDNVTLVAVSKAHNVEMIAKAYEAGQRVFGENKVQELISKHRELPFDIQWHMIGHLQTNKVKNIANFVELIHSVDTIKLWKEIDKQAKRINRKINCLLQVKIAQEESKFGLDKETLCILLDQYEVHNERFANICGLMGMSTLTDDQAQIENEFAYLRSLYKELKLTRPYLNTLSMGMSGDYSMAIRQGSTMIRVGSKIFGKRSGLK